jgi:two-component system sensor histidine kinase EvgS
LCLACLLLVGSLPGRAQAAPTLAGLSAEERAWIREHPVVRAGDGPPWPPLVGWRDDGRYDGASADLLALIAARTGLSFDVRREPDYAAVLRKLEAGDLDVAPLLAPSPARSRYLLFTPEVLKSTTVVVHRRGQTDYAPGASLAGRRIAIERGYVIHEHLRQQVPDAKLVETASTREALAAVAANSADLYIGGLPSAAYWVERDLLANLEVAGRYAFGFESLAMGVRATQPVLHGILQKAVASITDAERDALLHKWLPVRNLLAEDTRAFAMSAAERDWVARQQRILIGVDGFFPPVSIRMPDGSISGMAKDYLDLVSARTGLNFETGAATTWADALAAARRGEIDMLIAAARNPHREDYLTFVGPYVRIPTAVVVPIDAPEALSLADFAGRRVAILREHFLLAELRRSHPSLQLLQFDTQQDVLAAVVDGAADAGLGNLDVVTTLMRARYPARLRVATTVPGGDSELYFAARAERPELARVLKKALDAIGEADHRAIRMRWIATPARVSLPWHEIGWYGGAAAALMLAIVGALGWHTRRLQAEIARRTALEVELEASRNRALAESALKSARLATFSHEVRTPLNGVISGLEILAEQGLPPRAQSIATLAAEAAGNLLLQVNQLLDYVRIEAGGVKLAPHTADLAAAILEAANVIAPAAARKGVRLRLSVDPRPFPGLEVDGVRVRQVALNLIGNAVKFTPAGEVTVALQAVAMPGTGLCALTLTVTDTGPGIADDVRERLFSPFAQSTGTPGAAAQGSGLGLWICAEIARAMGGEIDVSSPPGRGASFRLSFAAPVVAGVAFDGERRFDLDGRWTAPAAAQGPAPAADAAAPAGAGPLVGMRVLLAEYDRLQQFTAIGELARAGCSIVAAGDGDEALDLWRDADFDLLLTDCHLPGRDGMALAGAVRERERALGLPRCWIVALTASTEAEIREACLQAGIDDVLVKPLSVDTLAALRGARRA